MLSDLYHTTLKCSSFKTLLFHSLGVLPALNKNLAGVINETTSEILKAKGEKVVLANLVEDDMAETIEDAFRYDKVILASSSYNAGVFPPMEHFLKSLKERNYQNRKIGIIENGSWAPSAGKEMKSILNEMKEINVVEPMVTIKSTMKDCDTRKLEELVNNLLLDVNAENI